MTLSAEQKAKAKAQVSSPMCIICRNVLRFLPRRQGKWPDGGIGVRSPPGGGGWLLPLALVLRYHQMRPSAIAAGYSCPHTPRLRRITPPSPALARRGRRGRGRVSAAGPQPFCLPPRQPRFPPTPWPRQRIFGPLSARAEPLPPHPRPQFEFYFSDSNLPGDKFLREQASPQPRRPSPGRQRPARPRPPPALTPRPARR